MIVFVERNMKDANQIIVNVFVNWKFKEIKEYVDKKIIIGVHVNMLGLNYVLEKKIDINVFAYKENKNNVKRNVKKINFIGNK